jgi:hypothetical protein
LVRLPAGNRVEALDTARRDSLSSPEFRGFIDLLPASGTREKKGFVLEKPRLALQQATGLTMPGWDPRLSPRGNRIQKQLSHLPEQRHEQGQRTLSPNPDKDLRQELFAPSALPTPSSHAVPVRTLPEQ